MLWVFWWRPLSRGKVQREGGADAYGECADKKRGGGIRMIVRVRMRLLQLEEHKARPLFFPKSANF
jgi:hypothetical protein